MRWVMAVIELVASLLAIWATFIVLTLSFVATTNAELEIPTHQPQQEMIDVVRQKRSGG